MTELPHDGDLERLVQQYLHELGRDLGRLPASQRDRLVGEIRDHITELRAERPPRDASDMEALLNRVGLPEDIAAVALEDIDDLDTTDSVQSEAGTSGVRGRVRRFRLLVGAAGAAILLVLVVLVGVNATHHSDVPRFGRDPLDDRSDHAIGRLASLSSHGTQRDRRECGAGRSGTAVR